MKFKEWTTLKEGTPIKMIMTNEDTGEIKEIKGVAIKVWKNGKWEARKATAMKKENGGICQPRFDTVHFA